MCARIEGSFSTNGGGPCLTSTSFAVSESVPSFTPAAPKTCADEFRNTIQVSPFMRINSSRGVLRFTRHSTENRPPNDLSVIRRAAQAAPSRGDICLGPVRGATGSLLRGGVRFQLSLPAGKYIVLAFRNGDPQQTSDPVWITRTTAAKVWLEFPSAKSASVICQ